MKFTIIATLLKFINPLGTKQIVPYICSYVNAFREIRYDFMNFPAKRIISILIIYCVLFMKKILILFNLCTQHALVQAHALAFVHSRQFLQLQRCEPIAHP